MIGNLRLATDRQLAVLHEYPERVKVFLYGADDEATISHDPSHDLDLGKTWDGLDHLLEPMQLISAGGRALGEPEEGHGPARSFTAAQVASLSATLKDVGEAQLHARLESWHGESEGLLEQHQQLKNFLAAATVKKLGLIAYFSR